ncbi:sulfatase-like hydrolase/transferase [Cyclobacterium jeungdonense]|uniref:Sulfatase-like hydrolase/transferase n=1 Tax=Cyclobacterium jeungdonense TaxID=708087 RepID=A0ABT8C180_9BACT|nr:sulfatase-like hydrolase/transferase [Cyclobacterium jeungdonense]MDN3686240.1 sulfatase-like hydrolase/transferase [Cyclobacterium jeungdonense]
MKIKLLFLEMFLLLTGFAQAQDASDEQPNFIFIFSDDQRYDVIGALGHPEVLTPNLDRLVKEGSTFTHAYNMGAWNGAVCVASRAMMISGLSVWDAREQEKNFQQMADAGQFWPQLLQKSGYETYMTGKWHVKADAESIFQNVVHVRPGMPNQTPEGYDRPKSRADTTWQPWDKSFEGFWKGGKHWSEVLADDARGFLDQAGKSESPFMMYLAFNAPHDPRQAPKEFVDLYPVESIALPSSHMDMYPYKDSIGLSENLRDEALAPFPRTAYSVRKNIQEYYAIISHMDAQIGKILDALEETGKMKNTYIIFTADHGLAVGHHGLMGKQNMFDHSVRAPLLLVGPGIPKGKQYHQQVYLQDVSATIMDLAGIEKPKTTVFNSLMPYIEENVPSAYPSIYSCYLDLQRMVRTDRYKLIFYPKLNKTLLFDLEKDPEELRDRSADPAYQGVKKQLLVLLSQQQQAVNDPLGTINEM